MIKVRLSINDINKYQKGNLPDNAIKIETPESIDEMMKKSAPIAVILCMLLFATMLCKTILSGTVVISPLFILVGFIIGFVLLLGHEWLTCIFSIETLKIYCNVFITLYTGISTIDFLYFLSC